MRIIYGETPVRMKYSEEELQKKVNEKIESMKNRFSFKSLCVQIFSDALLYNKLDKDDDTAYYNPIMSQEDGEKISRILWEKIWGKELFIDFFKGKYDMNNSNDVFFCKRNA